METVTRVLRELSETIGPRFSASAGEHAAAELLAREFRNAGVDTELQRLNFIGWSATAPATVEVTAPEVRQLEAAPVVYSAPAANIEGRVVSHGVRVLIKDLYEMFTFAVLDDDGAPVAQLVVNSRGGAIPLINPSPMYRMPQLVITEDAATDIRNWLEAGDDVRVRLNFDSELDADAYSYNVIGRYVGDPETTEHIVVCAHYDTQIDSPGAYDNASGTAALFGILEHVQALGLAVNVTFLGIAGEEVGMFGSEFYVNNLVERGLLSDVRYCVCLDQISGGEFFWLWCSDQELRAKGLDAIKAADVESLGPVQVDDNKPGADHWAFHERGVPACLLMWWRQAEYHRSTDTFEKVDLDRVKVALDSACGLVETLAEEL